MPSSSPAHQRKVVGWPTVIGLGFASNRVIVGVIGPLAVRPLLVVEMFVALEEPLAVADRTGAGRGAFRYTTRLTTRVTTRCGRAAGVARARPPATTGDSTVLGGSDGATTSSARTCGVSAEVGASPAVVMVPTPWCDITDASTRLSIPPTAVRPAIT